MKVALVVIVKKTQIKKIVLNKKYKKKKLTAKNQSKKKIVKMKSYRLIHDKKQLLKHHRPQLLTYNLKITFLQSNLYRSLYFNN